MSRALVLNASFEPLCVVSTRRALVLVIDDKAELVHSTDAFFHSERAAFPEPSVVRLCHYVKVPYVARVALNRRAVFARDGHRCQYCGAAAENIDHVIPRSRGGITSWENVVCSCMTCNLKKGGRTPEESRMRLLRHPTRPRWTPFFRGPPQNGRFYSQWLPFLTMADLAYWNVELRDED